MYLFLRINLENIDVGTGGVFFYSECFPAVTEKHKQLVFLMVRYISVYVRFRDTSQSCGAVSRVLWKSPHSLVQNLLQVSASALFQALVCTKTRPDTTALETCALVSPRTCAASGKNSF